MEKAKVRGGGELSELQIKKIEDLQKEKAFAQQQADFANRQLHENKRIHETLTRALNRDRHEEEKAYKLIEQV